MAYDTPNIICNSQLDALLEDVSLLQHQFDSEEMALNPDEYYKMIKENLERLYDSIRELKGKPIVSVEVKYADGTVSETPRKE